MMKRNGARRSLELLEGFVDVDENNSSLCLVVTRFLDYSSKSNTCIHDIDISNARLRKPHFLHEM